MKVGIDLGGSHIGIGVIDENNNLIEKEEMHFTDEEKKNPIPVIEKNIVQKVEKLENKYEIESIGIAVPGSVRDGVILKAVNLGIYNYDLKTVLEEKLNKKVSLRNDAKCACLAEYNNIVKNNPEFTGKNMLFLSIGTGIGGGYIYKGSLFGGNNFEGCEYGHMVIKENGIPCKCGKSGCFERYGSILEYKNRVRERLKISNDINSDPLREIMNQRKNEFNDIEEQYVSDLALGISNLINIFEPDMIVLGGGYAKFHYMFEDNLKDKLINSSLLFNKRENINIRTAELGNDAGIIGATIFNWGRSFLIGDGP